MYYLLTYFLTYLLTYLLTYQSPWALSAAGIVGYGINSSLLWICTLLFCYTVSIVTPDCTEYCATGSVRQLQRLKARLPW